MQRLQQALDQIQFARAYSLRLLDQTDPRDWFWQPHEGVTHIAWQVGHLAMAEYRLVLERVRGVRTADESLIPPRFLTQFGKESVPDPDPAAYPSPAEIRSVFDRVHAQALIELPQLSPRELDVAPLKLHPLFDTKLGSLLWCANHELLHAGQIALLRRLHGQNPLW